MAINALFLAIFTLTGIMEKKNSGMEKKNSGAVSQGGLRIWKRINFCWM